MDSILLNRIQNCYKLYIKIHKEDGGDILNINSGYLNGRYWVIFSWYISIVFKFSTMNMLYFDYDNQVYYIKVITINIMLNENSKYKCKINKYKIYRGNYFQRTILYPAILSVGYEVIKLISEFKRLIKFVWLIELGKYWQIHQPIA